MDHKALIGTFYDSFARADVEGMIRCYHKDVVFTDPAFGELQGDDARTMWRMLIECSKGKVTVRLVSHTEDSAHWVADYVFSQTGRKVENRVTSHFGFRDGLIIRQTDSFDLWKWSRQALGWSGYLLG